MKSLTSCKNLGPTIIRNLSLVGVTSFEELQDRGPSKIYLQLKETFPDKTWPVCYYLYSLEGALTNTHWDHISDERKSQLLYEIGK